MHKNQRNNVYKREMRLNSVPSLFISCLLYPRAKRSTGFSVLSVFVRGHAVCVILPPTKKIDGVTLD